MEKQQQKVISTSPKVMELSHYGEFVVKLSPCNILRLLL